MFKLFQTFDKKQVIATSAGALAIIIGVTIPMNRDMLATSLSYGSADAMEVTAAAPARAFDLYIDGQVVGTIPDESIATSLIESVKKNIAKDLGYEPEYDFELEVLPSTKAIREADEENVFLTALEASVYGSIDVIKVQAYVMKIDDYVVAVKDEATLIEVLEEAQRIYVQDDKAISVELVQDPHNPLVLTPEVNVISKSLPEEHVFVTSAMTNGEPMEDLEADHDEFIEAVVKEVDLEQQIVVVSSWVPEGDVVDAATAIEQITKEHEKEKVYVVESGDSPSVIAVQNSMSTKDLYSLNPGLEENARRMQVGDTLVVMVPEPELFVTTSEDVIYTEIIDRDQTFVNNSDEYIGTYKTIEEGADGVLEVRASIKKVNGKVVDKEILETTVIAEPKTEKLYRGTKALPVTTATGTFEMPMLTYKFTSPFGYRWGRLHQGIDLAAPTGTKIKASDGGRVIQAGWDGGYGYSIEIDHGKGRTTKYGHCSKLYVSVGDEVGQYETIAAVGSTGNSTGPHLHFEIRINGTPKDPMNYLK